MDLDNQYNNLLSIHEEGLEDYAVRTIIRSKLIASMIQKEIMSSKIEKISINPSDNHGSIDIAVKMQSGKSILICTKKDLISSYYGNRDDKEEIEGIMNRTEDLGKIIKWLSED